MMNFKEIQELIKQINKSNIAEFKVKQNDFEINIRTDKFVSSKGKAVAPQMVPVQPASIPALPTFSPPPAQQPVPPPATTTTDVPEEAKDQKLDESKYLQIKSPMVGTFYRSSSPDKPAYVKVGDRVELGSVVCIVEAMKLFNEIESEVTGVIVKALVEDAQPVEYDQVLYLVDPKG